MTVRLHVLGGLGVFGQNCMVFEDVETGDAVMVDAGAGFPREAGGGNELAIPDPEVLRQFKGRLKGYLVTHGHEDHIGAIGYFNRYLRAPVYGAPTSLALIRHRCEDVDMPIPEMHVLLPGEDIAVGSFHVSALAVSHSIPDSLCLLLEAGGVKILHSGDFRVDTNPLTGPATDMSGISSLQDRCIDLLLADSTGAITPGHNPGERSVMPGLTKIFEKAPRRIYITTFASHIQRLQAVADLSARFGRRILLVGRGAINHTRIARGLGGADWLDGHAMGQGEAQGIAPHKMTVILSGCQGEDRSAFYRLATGDGRIPKLAPWDTVIHSARAVPGNEGRVAGILDLCARQGATIVDGKEGVHVSGHGYTEDLQGLMRAVRPRAVMPVHGGFRHLHAMALLAQGEGIDEDCTPVCATGDVVEVAPGVPPRLVDHIHVRSVLVGDDGELTPAEEIMDERRELLGGLVVISATVDGRSGELKGRPLLSTRGLAGNLHEVLDHEGAHEAHVSFNALPLEERMDEESVRNALAKGVRRVLRRARGRPVALVAHAHVL